MRKPIIMDCDPGHDDAIALLLAFASDKLDVRCVTVSAGNQTIEKTLYNTKRILTLAGVEVPVAKGTGRPLFRDLIIAPEVHGESGLDGPDLPEPSFDELPVSAVELMRKTITDSDEPVTIVATGPLTNVAALLMVYPELKEKISGISLMGGAAIGGNWTSGAEFNILVDPEAADIVFSSGLPILMAGLDVTHKALIFPKDVEVIRSMKGEVSQVVAGWLDFFYKFHEADDFVGSPLHDPCAVAYLIKPELFTTVDCFVEIETKGRYTLGKTVADIHNFTDKPVNAAVCMDIDREGFLDLLIDMLKVYQKKEGTL